jgi:kynureninase
VSLTRADCAALDARIDPLGAFAARFAPGQPGTLYFDANSIGPMPADAPARLSRLLDDGWRIARRRGWNDADWLAQPRMLGAALAPIIGAASGDVLVCDSTSVNHYKLLRLALAAAAPKTTIVVQDDVFPSNRYVAQGIAHGGAAQLRGIAGIDELPAALASGDVAVVSLSHVDYRSGERLDMAACTELAHRHGSLALWDLSHSAGAVAVRLRDADADLAVGCGYKYLCGGPGAPALLYVHPRLHDAACPAIAGWMGHADTFAFAADYRPAAGVARQQVGTPAVIANALFAAAADIWREVDPAALDARHRSLTDTLVALVEQRAAARGVELAGPRQHAQRGGHVALRIADGDVAKLAQALVEAGVVVSARRPDALRLAVHPLTTRHVDLWDAVERLCAVLDDGRWRQLAGSAI